MWEWFCLHFLHKPQTAPRCDPKCSCGLSDTIKPRLERCGADCRKVAFINEETYSGLTLDDERAF